MPRIDIKKVFADISVGFAAKRELIKEMRKDAEYALGKQWDEEAVHQLERAGVKALTINKIKPMVKLITGIERQGRSDFVVFPEGEEDELVAEIATRLLKNIAKNSRVHNKASDVFKEGIIVGESYIEPYIDYTFDLINGDLKFRKVNGSNILMDPSGEEYDLSDRRFVVKITPDLSREDLEMLFPDDKQKIEDIGSGKLDLDNALNEEIVQTRDYPKHPDDMSEDAEAGERTYDLVEYYYKSMIDQYYVASRSSQGILAETNDRDEAEAFIVANRIEDAQIIQKKVPEIRLKQIVGRTEFSDERAWTYPRWKSYPFIPFFAEHNSFDMDDKALMIQGIVRALRDLQFEYNKRRTQELNHLNSSINSGSFIPKGALDRKNLDKMKKFGSSPGVVIEWDPAKAGGTSPQNWKVFPTPLSQGHAQLAAENAQDIRETSGVNPDLLATTSDSQSGRALLVKQRQGVVMIQEPLDNYSHTKELLGRFILTQLGEVYTVETAIKVLGQQFLENNFREPVFSDDGNPVLENGEIKTTVNAQEAGVFVNKVLNDSSIGKFDVSIGEGAFNETIKFTNFLTLMELIEKGVQIPIEIIIQESGLSEAQKKKIIEAIERAQQASLQAGQGQGV